jgi:glycine cleavage system H protein
MKAAGSKTLSYKRSRFTTHLPVAYAYTASHAWLASEPDGVWRVGFTRFATRMLGEMVDHGFEVEPSSRVTCGQIIGWVEGFKAISDLFCVAEGEFWGGNPVLKETITLVNKDPYGQGWLYRIKGRPDAKAMDVHAYVSLLDKTIDKILEKQRSETSS